MKDNNIGKSKEKLEGKFMSSVKVGPKGQIVIPKEARELFNIQPGDTLILLADVERGIAIQRFEMFQKFSDQVFGKEEI
ncbi:AbrB family looped-hinge helix DNA binding protein [Mobilisporobacter senegalensis]|uniref:AbrB family looped-hinge helix DNA binding protein n=1 Tax=Mobilisporobacter senegalensis TaxID=1329262 RepID=A0A3N1XI44_9FIRM|nr:AbrB/MazE/SpoVT family DNA-binding domain-containing protein [Mobilisporobacter senegalensis]ROR25801.1 AbrB family looped-hinge helix DNA binding protein [Mobilisporobacter senegalensis]